MCCNYQHFSPNLWQFYLFKSFHIQINKQNANVYEPQLLESCSKDGYAGIKNVFLKNETGHIVFNYFLYTYKGRPIMGGGIVLV